MKFWNGVLATMLPAGLAWIAMPLDVARAQTPPPLPKTEAPTLSTVKPPEHPKTNGFFISEKALAALPKPQQPPELQKALQDLQEGSIDERVAKLKAKAIADLVYVRGGSFMRGDFAPLLKLDGVERMTYNEDDKVVRKITLSDFWMSRYKASYAELDVFADATNRPRTGMEYDGQYRHPLLPAGMNWQYANDYCLWLGKITGYKFQLPTEAQWEYAARSRGQFFMLATDDGNVAFGRNLPYPTETDLLSPIGSASNDRYPVGMFPPNPLGLFDMASDEEEWVADWYAADAYRRSKDVDPKGPDSGTMKVSRGWGSDGDSPRAGGTVWRWKHKPFGEMPKGWKGPKDKNLISDFLSPTVRCAVD